MTLQSASTPESNLRNQDLAVFMPGRDKIAEFGSRLKSTLSYRGADKLSNHECLALAAASMAHNLNPYIGEIWAIPGKGLMIGRAGWVKKLNEMSDSRKFRWWDEYHVIREHEREQYGIPKDAKLAYVCELRRSDTLETYITLLERMNKAMKLEYEQIMELLGRPPVIRGVGYIGAGEDLPGSMSIGERCKKRAFAQACKEIVHLPFEAVTEGDVVDGQVINGEYVEEVASGESHDDQDQNGSGDSGESKAAEPDKKTEPEIKVETEAKAEVKPEEEIKSIEPKGPETRPASAEDVRGYVNNLAAFYQAKGLEKEVSEGFRGFVAMLIAKALGESATLDKDRHAITRYITGKDSLKDHLHCELLALRNWLAGEDDGDELGEHASVEAQNVLKAALKDEGQLEMELPTAEPKKAEKPAKAAVKPKTEAKPATKPTNPKEVTIEALKQSSPSSWVIATQWLAKELGFKENPGKLMTEVKTKMGDKFSTEAPLRQEVWWTAIQIAAGA